MQYWVDDYGNEIQAGDTIEVVVGIPGRTVVAKIEDRKGLVAVSDDGNMRLAEVLKWYNTERVGTKLRRQRHT